MPSASIRPPALVRRQSSWSIAGAHYKHWATSLGNFGVTPFFGGNFWRTSWISPMRPALQRVAWTNSAHIHAFPMWQPLLCLSLDIGNSLAVRWVTRQYLTIDKRVHIFKTKNCTSLSITVGNSLKAWCLTVAKMALFFKTKIIQMNLGSLWQY